ncbi:MAG TPA: type II toxin-antitoxin system YafQ family toxin [Candidatus Paceibacterota bacterium]|nr:type II toxin-antitoxin system YafQ family toxin [Candidatus Paceibacterota bacterium]HMO82672.1 type II toxin-antitoxin system YafQ family toxin [Candidatus Paceibacterota bacterium]
MYKLRSTKVYRTAFKKATRHKDFKIHKYNKVIDLLLAGEPLPQAYKDHALTGNFKGFRECHIQNDLLLMYQKHEDILVLLLINIGSHSKLFK